MILYDVGILYGSHLCCILLLVFEGQNCTSCMESKMTEKIVTEKRWSMNQENLINPVPAVTVAMHHQIQMTVQVQSYCIMLHEIEKKMLGTMNDINNLLGKKFSEMDEEECERRRTECMDNLVDLERQFTLLREQ